jgi:hypothetical protein
MIRSLRLPFCFDPTRLQGDLALLNADDWVPHFNQAYYTGEWSGAALRSVGGSARQLFQDPTKTEFMDTPLMARCSYFQQVMSTFECPLESIRLLRLRAGSQIKEHRDFGLSYEDGVFRLHIPIVTNPQLEFYLEDERLDLREGECWYLDFNRNHRICNGGVTDRVHLVVDGLVNDWVRMLFAAGVTTFCEMGRP